MILIKIYEADGDNIDDSIVDFDDGDDKLPMSKTCR